MGQSAEHMKAFWDARAKENAEYYVDNRLDYESSDEERFWSQAPADLDSVLGQVGSPLGPDDHVLDLGCGVGRLTKVLAQRCAHVTGIDIAPDMVRQARENLADLSNVEFVEGDGTSLAPLPDAGFDAVISLVVFQHIPDPQITLGYVREIARVLKPGGWATFQISNDPAIHTADYPRPSRIKQLLGRAPKGQDDPAWRGSAVTLEDLRATVDASGLSIAQITGEGTQYCLVRVVRAG